MPCKFFLGEDTFTPITNPAKLPKNAIALWEDYDARAEDLEVEIIEEWKTEEVTTRYQINQMTDERVKRRKEESFNKFIFGA